MEQTPGDLSFILGLSDSAELNPLLWVTLTPSMGRLGSSPSPLTAEGKTSPFQQCPRRRLVGPPGIPPLESGQPNKWCQTRLAAHYPQNLDLQLIFRQPGQHYQESVHIETTLMGWSLFSLSHLHPAPSPNWKTPDRVLSLCCHSTDLPWSRKTLCHA